MGEPWEKIERAIWRTQRLTVSQWADAYRVLDAKTSSEPGPWSTERAPYLRGPMDAFSDGDVEIIDIRKPVQSGGTESILNMLGWAIDVRPAPALLVEPRDEDCEYVAADRIKPMIELSPALQKHKTGRVWDLSKQKFTLDNMPIYFAGSNSPAGLAIRPVCYLFLDEVDKYPAFSGREAAPSDLAIKRTLTYPDRKIVRASTPTTTEGEIDRSYEKSNKCRYFIPCPHCGEWAFWKFVHLKIHKKLRDPDEIRLSVDGVWYECEFCKKKLYEDEKDELVGFGLWLPEGVELDSNGKKHGEPKRDKRHSGFAYSALISAWVTWREMMAQWFEANTESGITRGKLMDFKNALLGEPYQEAGKKVNPNELAKLRSDYARGTVPSDVTVLVASADYHKSRNRNIVRIDWEVRGFAPGLKNYLIDIGSEDSFDKLDEAIFSKPFPWADGAKKESKPWLAVVQLFIDSGYEPDDVYDYCRQRRGLAMPIKGLPTAQLKPLRITSLEDATMQRLGPNRKRRYRGMQLVLVDTIFFKNLVTNWVEQQYDEDGKIIGKTLTQFFDGVPQYYLTEFSNEHKVRVQDSAGNTRFIWKPIAIGAPTHSLDTAVYTAAAAFYLGVQYAKPKQQGAFVPAALKQRQAQRKPVKRQSSGGFLDGLPRL